MTRLRARLVLSLAVVGGASCTPPPSAAPGPGTPMTAPAPNAASASDPITPNEQDPAIRTARRLFPTAFGLASSEPRASGILYTPVTYGLDVPASHCLNLVGQPAIIEGGLTWVARSDAAAGETRFRVVGPLLFRDRRAGYVLGLSKGAQGAVATADKAGVALAGSGVARLKLPELSVIAPDGRETKLAATLDVERDGLVRLCADEPRYRSPECGGEAADPATRLPYELDLRRCEPGCERLCPKEAPPVRACDQPPAPVCVGSKQRLFFSGVDIGGACLFEEWDLECATGCASDRCRAQGPAVQWSIPLVSRRWPPVRLGADALAMMAEDELVAVSGAGSVLWREKPSSAGVVALTSDGEGGHLFTLDAHGNLRAGGKSATWQTNLGSVTRPSYAGLAVRATTLHAAWGTKVFAYDAASGQRRWSTDVGAEVRHAPVLGVDRSVLQASGKELTLLDASGTVSARALLGTPALWPPALTSRGDVLVVTEDGAVSFGRLDALRRVATLTGRLLSGPVLAGDGAVLVVTGGPKPGEGDSRLHKLELPSGRGLWERALPGEWLEPPLLDAQGNVILVGQSVVALGAGGEPRWSLDLRGSATFGATALLGPDGTLYLRTFERLTALGPI